MRPGFAALEGEIVGIGDGAVRRRLRLYHLIGNAVAPAIGDRLLGAVEPQPHLLAHVARAGPAHQRLDLAGLLGLELKQPFLGLGGARLHRRSCGLVDACDRHAVPGFGSDSGQPSIKEAGRPTRRTATSREQPGTYAGGRRTYCFSRSTSGWPTYL